jgi:AraC family transcriptional regulator
MTEVKSHLLLATDTVKAWDVLCSGTCRHKSDEECVTTTHLVFPYRGVYVRHTGQAETVAEANQVVFFNETEPYRVSHPIDGGDASLSIGIDEATLLELVPADVLRAKDRTVFNRARMRIVARVQLLAAFVRHRLTRGMAEPLEAEDLILSLVSRAVGKQTSYAPSGSAGRQKLVDRTKLVLSSNLGRRWTLAEIGGAVGVSPIYLTQVFRQVEGLPLYRYQLQLRLARALDLLDNCTDLTSLAFELGFSSYSHFSTAFKQAYGLTPLAFQRSS